MFTHELVHLPREGFRGFRFVWNVLCGIPFLIPSFTYYPHVDHHRRKSYGTEQDAEYLTLSHQSPWQLVFYLLGALATPAAMFLRFAIFTPLSWVWPYFRKWTFWHASTMVMDLMYVRPEAGKQVQRIRMLQEIGCFAFCIFVVFRGQIFHGEWYDPFWINAYAIAVLMVLINNVRTLGAHRWTGDGQAMSFESQLLDTVDYPYRSWITELWGPVGTRYHATHHLFPSIPYHNLGKAHRRLRAGLPPNSPFHETIRISLLSEIGQLWWRAMNRSQTVAQLQGKSSTDMVTPA
jgi:fatty acid desaturase